MLSTAQALIKADYTVSLINDLHVIYNALPIFVPAGHYSDMKSAHLYLQEMSEMDSNNSKVCRMFKKGLHVIYRATYFYAGLGCDLVIERKLMKSLNTSGGLTHGSKMTEDHLGIVVDKVCSYGV